MLPKTHIQYEKYKDIIDKTYDDIESKVTEISDKLDSNLKNKISHSNDMINKILLNYDRFSRYPDIRYYFSYEAKEMFAQYLVNLLTKTKQTIEKNIEMNKYASFDKEILNNLIDDLSGLTDSTERLKQYEIRPEYSDDIRKRTYEAFRIKENYKNLNKMVAIDVLVSKFHSNRHLLIDMVTSLMDITDVEKSTVTYRQWKLETENRIIDKLNYISIRDEKIIKLGYHILVHRYSLEDDYEENWL